MTAATPPAALRDDLADDLDRLGLDPAAYSVVRAPRRSGRTFDLWRVWDAAGDLVAGTCRECRALHPAEDLRRKRQDPGGRAPECLRCSATASAERHAADPDAARERSRRYRTEHADAVRGYARERAARLTARTDAEILAAREAAHPAGTKPCGSCRAPLPFDDFADDGRNVDGLSRRCRRCDAARRARHLRPLLRVLTVDESVCVYCQGPADTIDHLIPQSRGGRHIPSDLVASCGPCNSTKYNADPRDFLADRLGVEESFEVLRERLPSALLIGEDLDVWAARQETAVVLDDE